MIATPLSIRGSFLLEKGLHITQPEISFSKVVDRMHRCGLTKLNGCLTMVLESKRLNPDLFCKIYATISPALVHGLFDAPKQGRKHYPVLLRQRSKQCKFLMVQEFFFYFKHPW